MNRGILQKALWELAPLTLFCGLLLLAFEALLGFVLPAYAEQFSAQMLQLDFFQNILKAMLGVSFESQIGPAMFNALPWVHPVALAVVWAHAILACSRVPAGEVDSGLIDLWLGQPVSRGQVMVSETLAWLISALVLLTLGFFGALLGRSFLDPNLRGALAPILLVLQNLFCLYLAIGGIAWLFSACSGRKGRAAALAFLVVLASFLLHYLCQFWQALAPISALSLMAYYGPLTIMERGTAAWPDMAVLLAVAAASWALATWIFSRRDLCTT